MDSAHLSRELSISPRRSRRDGPKTRPSVGRRAVRRGQSTPRTSRDRDDRRTTSVAPPHRSIPACSASCLLAGDRSRSPAPNPTPGVPNIHWPPRLPCVASPAWSPTSPTSTSCPSPSWSRSCCAGSSPTATACTRWSMRWTSPPSRACTSSRSPPAPWRCTRHSNDMVWRVHLRERGEDDAVAPAGRADRSTSPPGGDGAQPEGSAPWRADPAVRGRRLCAA